MELPFPLHAEPISIFGSLFLDDAYESSHMLAMPLTLAPVRHDAGRPDLASRLDQQPCGLRLHCQRAFNNSLPNCFTSWGTADGTAGPVVWPRRTIIGATCRSHPLVEPFRRNEAATALHRLSECRARGNSF